MSLCWPSLFLLLSLFSTRANAANISLSSELTNFVPVCAQECFISFLDSNFPTSVCTSNPSLACLCSNKSTSGYTVGEGAVQCIISEDSINGCQGADSSEAVVVDAYTMCNGQNNALPNTHSTLTATLIVQSSQPSIVLIAPSTSIMPKSASTTSSPVSITTSKTTAPPTSITATSSEAKTLAPVPSNTAQAASETPSSNPSLTNAQIVGITVASIGGGALALGILIFIACVRRRKRVRDSDMLPFQLEPSYQYRFNGPTEVMKKQNGPGGTANGIAARIAPPVPARIDTGSPNMFARRSIKPDTIGLAFSPDKKEIPEQRHSSKLLPDKPTLTLDVPQQQSARMGGVIKFSQPGQLPSAISRQSTATQFEEDDDSAVPGREDWGRGSTDGVLSNEAGDLGTIRPVAPVDGTLPQFVLSSIDWKPPHSNTKPEPVDDNVKPLNINRSIGSFSRPLVVRTDPFPRPPPPAALQIPTQTTRPITQSSSVYSAHNSLPPSDAGPNPAVPGRKSYKQKGPYDRQMSTGSITSFDSTESMDPDPKTAVTDLSPVVESPASGKSPVSYPKIPGKLSRDYIRMVPPPSQPDFASVFSSQSQLKPWRIAEMNAQRERDRVQRESLVQAEGLGIVQPQYQPYKQQEVLAPSAANNLPSSHPQPSYPNPSQSPQNIPSRPGALSNNPSNSRGSSLVSQKSNASSLLAKRRGEQKAHALMLMNEEDKKKQQAKWRVLQKSDKERAMSPNWRPQLAGGGQVLEQMEVPVTPGWMPKLTPTRRGDELFLSVT